MDLVINQAGWDQKLNMEKKKTLGTLDVVSTND